MVITDKSSNTMTHKLLSLIFYIFILIEIYHSNHTHAQFASPPQEPVNPSDLQIENDGGLLNLLKQPTLRSMDQKQAQSTKNQVQAPLNTNPFSLQKSITMDDEDTAESETEEPLNSFEYRVDAIWAVNNAYKALISGHIVSESDTINNIEIQRISKRSITIMKNNTLYTFELGKVFYDYEL